MSLTDTGHAAQLREQVREIIATTFLMDAAELPDDVSQANCGRWSSLYHMMLILALEEQFGLTLSTNEMTSMTSLAAIVGVLNHHGVRSLAA